MKLDELILKELDSQRIRSNVITFIMEKLNDNNEKLEFLDFMITNRTVLLNEIDILSFLFKSCVKLYN